MKQPILYIKIDKNIQVTNKKVYLEDVAKLYSPDINLVHDLSQCVVMNIDSEEDVKYCFSIMKIIQLIDNMHPEAEVVNLGETEFILSYEKPKKPKKLLEYIKTAFIGLIIFFGGAFSIMTFNEDASIKEIFGSVYQLVMGEEKNGWSVLEIGYSVGIAIGVILFFNHFSKVKLTKDPTPMQIEMRKYEDDINSTLLEDVSRKGNTIDVD